MKQSIRILFFVLVFSATLLSACGAAPSVISPSGPKVEAAQVAFTGVIEAMNGTEWVVNGQTINVDPALMQNGPFIVGDTVKVEAKVASDGSVTVTSIETSGSADLAVFPTPETASGAPVAPLTGNTQSGLVIDDSGNEAFGTVDAITADTITIGGQVFTIASGAEFKNPIAAGDFVKVHFVTNADGTLSIIEIESSDPALIGDNSNVNDNTNDDNSNDDNSNDDDNANGDDNSNGDDANSNDDSSGHGNGNGDD